MGEGRDPNHNGETWTVLQDEACTDPGTVSAKGLTPGWTVFAWTRALCWAVHWGVLVSSLNRCLITLSLGDKVPECLVQTWRGQRENKSLCKKALGCTLSKGRMFYRKTKQFPLTFVSTDGKWQRIKRSFTACQNVAGSGTDGQFISTKLGTSNKRNNMCFATLIFPPGIPAGDWDVWWQEWLDLCSPRAWGACFCGLAIVLPNYPLLCSTLVRFLPIQKTIANLNDTHMLTYATTYRGLMFSYGHSFQYSYN